MEFTEITHYVVELSRWRISATASNEDEAQSKCQQLQETADEWNYDNPHKTPRYYQVMTVSEYYHGY